MVANYELYEKVKLVEGEGFVTIEDTERLSTNEILILIDLLAKDSNFQRVKNVTILLDCGFPLEVKNKLEDYNFKLHDETVSVKRDLSHLESKCSPYVLKSLHNISPEIFKKIWGRCMTGSLNSPSFLDMDEQMRSVEKELGPTYKDTCNIAYEGDEAIGVVMPHIEPGTTNEGRLFYFGLVPEARGKGKSVKLHYQALRKLKGEFGASYNVGGTSYKNKPMLKVFKHNGCKEIKRNKVYLRTYEGLV